MELFAEEDERADMERQYREGGTGYGTVKKRLAELVLDHFKEARARREEYSANPDLVHKVLADGAAKARANASEVMRKVRKAVGA